MVGIGLSYPLKRIKETMRVVNRGNAIWFSVLQCSLVEILFKAHTNVSNIFSTKAKEWKSYEGLWPEKFHCS